MIRRLLQLLCLLLVGALVGCSTPGPAAPAAPAASAGSSGASAVPSTGTDEATWLSGSAGPGVVDGSFAEWRGSEVPVTATWADTNDAMVNLYELQPGAQFDGWEGHLDISVGAIGPDETWAEAAAGAYDDRWRQSLSNLETLRGDRDATTYIRFAHEMNGDWYDWGVDRTSAEDFVVAWHRFRELQQELYPEAELVFSVSSESVGTGMDWRDMFPGAEHVDLMGVDQYNQYPWVSTVEEWESSVLEVDQWGAPKGLVRHAEFAEQVGLPFSVNEWSNNASMGDSPVYMEQMHRFFQAYAGDGPGRLVYEVHFNIDQDDNSWAVHPETRMPESAEAYRQLF